MVLLFSFFFRVFVDIFLQSDRMTTNFFLRVEHRMGDILNTHVMGFDQPKYFSEHLKSRVPKPAVGGNFLLGLHSNSLAMAMIFCRDVLLGISIILSTGIFSKPCDRSTKICHSNASYRHP